MSNKSAYITCAVILAVTIVLAAGIVIFINRRKKKDLAPVREGFVLDDSTLYDNQHNAILGYNPNVVSGAVKQWQRALNEHQVMLLVPDGRFGPKTAQATYNLIGEQYVTSIEFATYVNNPTEVKA